MNEPVKWNRRGFTVTPNGYFNVLKSTGWFAAFRLPAGFRYLGGKKAVKRSPTVDQHPFGGPKDFVLPDLDAGPRNLRFVLRTLTLILMATVLTGAGLLWVMHP